jgi:hypothetical protein
MNSNFFKLNWADLGKGAVVVIATSVVTGVYAVIQAGGLPSLAALQQIGVTGLLAGIGYLCKNFLTNSGGQLLAAEDKITK